MLMLILLNHYMFKEVMRYLHDINYIVLHCIVFYDVNLTIYSLDRPIPAEFTKGFSKKTSLINIHCL